MSTRTLSARLIHSSARTRARLVDSSISVSPDYGRAAAPPPPAPVWTPSSARAPKPPAPPVSSTYKGPLRPDPQAAAFLKDLSLRGAQSSPTPPAPPRTTPTAPSQEPEGSARRNVEHEEQSDHSGTLDIFLLRTLAQLSVRRESVAASPHSAAGCSLPADLHTLLRQHREREGRIISNTTLSYEPMPGPSRRVRLDGRAGTHGECEVASDGAQEQDGTVVVAHVLGGARTKVSVCSGFAIGKSGPGEGQLILTAAHTLESMQQDLRRSEPGVPSATFVLASSGHVWTVSSIASSSSASDLLLLRLSPSPLNASSAIPARRLRSLPVNPYPPAPSSKVALHTYINPLSRLRRKLARQPEREWKTGRVAEYKDAIGRTAEVGTYDELAAMWLDVTPTSGSSGGPVIDCESGSVVGVTRGSTHTAGERQSYGFATPAERIFELFPLPGFRTMAQRQADKEKAAAVAPRSAAHGGEGASSGGTQGEAK